MGEPIFFRTLAPGTRASDDRATTVATQRARLLHGMTAAVAEKGYANVTVADIVAIARVSRRTFYEHFENVQDAFVAAYEEATTLILEAMIEAVRTARAPKWEERLSVAMLAYTEALASDPAMARACLVDVLGAGDRAVEARRAVFSRFVNDMIALRHGGSASASVIPDVQFRAAVGAISELVQEHIFDRGAESLSEIAPTLTHVTRALIAQPNPVPAGPLPQSVASPV